MDLMNTLLESFNYEDDLGVVIRAHVVIEQYLNQFISSFMVNNRNFEKMNLEYSQTLQLAIALGLTQRFESPLKALGKMRNDFAHTIRPSIGEVDVKNLYATLAAEDKETLQSTVIGVQKNLGYSEIIEHKRLEPKQQFTNIVIVLAAGLDNVCSVAT